MPKRQSIEEVEIQAGTGAVALSVDNYVDIYRVYTDGAVTLTSSVTIDESGTAQLGMEYLFYYQANLNYNGNTFTFFGVQMPDDLQDVNCWIRCFYNGTSWEVTVTTSFANEPFIATAMINSGAITQSLLGTAVVGRTELIDNEIIATKLATDSVTSAKIQNGAVTIDKLGGTLNYDIVTMEVSFEAGEQSNNSITVPYNCTLSTVRYDVITDIEATDDATITPQINRVSTSPSTITIPGNTLTNSTATQAMASANNITAGDELRMITSKTTAGGRVRLTLTLNRA